MTPSQGQRSNSMPPVPGLSAQEQAALSACLPRENGINLWAELKTMLTRVGSWHVIRRYSKEQKCSCRRARANDEPSPDCQICAGRGWPYREFPALLYPMSQVAAGASPELAGTLFNMAEENLLFFAPPEAMVASSDIIFEVALTPDQKIARPVRRLGRFNVGRVLPMRGDRDGAIDFLLVLAAEEEGHK